MQLCRLTMISFILGLPVRSSLSSASSMSRSVGVSGNDTNPPPARPAWPTLKKIEPETMSTDDLEDDCPRRLSHRHKTAACTTYTSNRQASATRDHEQRRPRGRLSELRNIVPSKGCARPGIGHLYVPLCRIKMYSCACWSCVQAAANGGNSGSSRCRAKGVKALPPAAVPTGVARLASAAPPSAALPGEEKNSGLARSSASQKAKTV